jgi:hypothetical protein
VEVHKPFCYLRARMGPGALVKHVVNRLPQVYYFCLYLFPSFTSYVARGETTEDSAARLVREECGHEAFLNGHRQVVSSEATERASLITNVLPQRATRPMHPFTHTPFPYKLLQSSRHPIQEPSTPALAHDPPTHQAHRAPTHTSASFTFLLARNARADTSSRGTEQCAIWVCISPSSSSSPASSPTPGPRPLHLRLDRARFNLSEVARSRR